MKYDLTDKILLVYPNTEWIRDGDTYSDLVFLDETIKLPENEFLALAEIKIQEKEEDDRLVKEQKEIEKNNLLAKLGITAEEVKLLLS